VPEFPPVSSCGCLPVCADAHRAFEHGGRLRSNAPEAEYLAAVRGIIARPWQVVAKQRASCTSGHRLGGGPGRLPRAQELSGPPEGGSRYDCRPRRVCPPGLTHAPDWADLEEIGQVDRGAQDVAAIELSSRWEARMTFPNPPVATVRVARLTQRDSTQRGSCGDSQKNFAPGCRLVTAGDGNMVRVDHMGHPRQAL